MFKRFLAFMFLFVLTGFSCVWADIEQDYNQKQKFYIFKIDTKKLGVRIKPYIVEEGLLTTREVFKQNDFKFVVNGGFFDPQSEKSVSYVVIDKVQKASPFDSIDLIKKLNDEKRVEKVINRAEFRVYEHNLIDNRLKFDISNHFDKAPENYHIKHVLGGGPMLYPSFNLEEEGFVAYDENYKPIYQSASVLKKRPRTILALKKDDLFVIIFTQFAPTTLSEAVEKLKKYKFDKIMALDGGPSTSLNFEDLEISSSNNDQRKVKSFLVIQK